VVSERDSCAVGINGEPWVGFVLLGGKRRTGVYSREQLLPPIGISCGRGRVASDAVRVKEVHHRFANYPVIILI